MKLGSAISFFGSFGKDRYKKMKEHGFDYADYDIGVALDGKADEECEAIVLAEKALADEAGQYVLYGKNVGIHSSNQLRQLQALP